MDYGIDALAIVVCFTAKAPELLVVKAADGGDVSDIIGVVLAAL